MIASFVNDRKLQYFSPVAIFAAVVFFQIFAAFIFGDYFYGETIVLVLYGFVSFAFGSVVFSCFLYSVGLDLRPGSSRYSFFIGRKKILFIILSLIGLLLSLYSFLKVYKTSSNLLDLFFQLRYARVYGEGDRLNPLGSDGGAGIFVLCAFVLFIYSLYVRNFRIVFFTLLVGLVYSFVMVERSSLFMWIICGVFVAFVCDIVKPKEVVFIVLLSLVMFFLIPFLASKTTEQNQFILYLIGGIAAFEQNILPNPGRGDGCLVFPSICFLWGGGKSIYGNLVAVGDDGFNVFTYLYAPYYDYGTLGVVLLMMIWGFVYQLIYSLAKKRCGFYFCFYAVMIYPLVMVFYSWLFSLNTFFYVFLMLFFLFWGSKRRVY